MRVSSKKKGSWLAGSRFLVKQRSGTNVAYFRRQPSIRGHRRGGAAKESRDYEPECRRGDDGERTSHALTNIEDEDDESCLDSSAIHNDRSLHTLGPLEKQFVAHVLSKLHPIMSAYAVGEFLRDICALEKPFDSMRCDGDRCTKRRPKVDVDPLFTGIEHAYSLCESALGVPMADRRLKRLVYSVLREMDVRAVDGSTRRGKKGSATQNYAWSNPPFMNIWDSVRYCHCGLFL